MLLTELLGRKVLDAGGEPVGRVADIAVELWEPEPVLSRLVLRSGRREPLREVPWMAVEALGPPVRLRAGATPAVAAALEREGELLLAAHVLDRQIFDARGMRLRRVGDLELVTADGASRLLAAEVGAAALFRRVGLRRLAKAFSAEVVDWVDLHIASGPGHRLQLRSRAAGVHRLSAEQLAALAARLPETRADEVLGAVESTRSNAARRLVPRVLEKRRRGPLRLRRRAPS